MLHVGLLWHYTEKENLEEDAKALSFRTENKPMLSEVPCFIKTGQQYVTAYSGLFICMEAEVYRNIGLL